MFKAIMCAAFGLNCPFAPVHVTTPTDCNNPSLVPYASVPYAEPPPFYAPNIATPMIAYVCVPREPRK